MEITINFSDDDQKKHKNTLQLDPIIEFFKKQFKPKFKVVLNTHKDSFRHWVNWVLPFVPQLGSEICFEYGSKDHPDTCTLKVIGVTYYTLGDYYFINLRPLDDGNYFNKLLKHWEKIRKGQRVKGCSCQGCQAHDV